MFDDQLWIEVAIALASKAGMYVVEDPMWDAQIDHEGLRPGAYLNSVRPGFVSLGPACTVLV